jgi:tripartite-type tricarboxylate transporter receptor subunit TctC
MNLADVRDRFHALSFTTIGNSRAEFAAYIQSEYAKWGKAAKESGARAD